MSGRETQGEILWAVQCNNGEQLETSEGDYARKKG